jgi:hypothetical protein
MLLTAERYGGKMLWLVETEAATAWKVDFCSDPPVFFSWHFARYAVPLEILDRRLEILTKKVELVRVVLISRMEGDFCGRQAKISQPPPASTAGICNTSRKNARSASASFV